MAKLWTNSRGPIAASDIDVRRAGAINALLVSPLEILPKAPGDPVRPLAVGIWHEIRPLLKPGIGTTVLRKAMGSYLHSKRYYLASAQPDAMRHDVDGRPVGEISDQDRLAAQESFLTLLKREGKEASAPVEAPMVIAAPSKAELIRAALLNRRASSAPVN